MCHISYKFSRHSFLTNVRLTHTWIIISCFPVESLKTISTTSNVCFNFLPKLIFLAPIILCLGPVTRTWNWTYLLPNNIREKQVQRKIFARDWIVWITYIYVHAVMTTRTCYRIYRIFSGHVGVCREQVLQQKNQNLMCSNLISN